MKTIYEYLLKNKTVKKYKYQPSTHEELQDIVKSLICEGEIDLNCIDVSKITDMNELQQR